MNLYGFVGNDSLNLWDFFGLEPCGEIYESNNTLSNLFGLTPVGYDNWSDYWSDVREVYNGYDDAIMGTLSGIVTAATSPIETAKGIGSAVSNLGDTYNAIATITEDTWNSGLRGKGRVMGEVFLAVATAGAGKAVATAGKAEHLVQVSRWGRPGLFSGDFVQLGSVTKANLAATGKFSSLGGNKGVVPFSKVSTGETFSVASSALHWPSGLDWIKGAIGQRIYDLSYPAMSYGSASAVGIGSGAFPYFVSKFGEANLWGVQIGNK